MAWYEDEELWVHFVCVMFPERREREVAEPVVPLALASWVGRPQAVDVDPELGGGTVFMRDTILDDWTRLRTDWTLVRGDTGRQDTIASVLYSPYDNHARRLIVRGVRG